MSEVKHTAGPWLVFNVGHVENEVSSNVVGIYADKEEAQEVLETCCYYLYWREGGPNDFVMFDLSAPQADEYSATLSESSVNSQISGALIGAAPDLLDACRALVEMGDHAPEWANDSGLDPIDLIELHNKAFAKARAAIAKATGGAS